jgi:hypothetical protein
MPIILLLCKTFAFEDKLHCTLKVNQYFGKQWINLNTQCSGSSQDLKFYFELQPRKHEDKNVTTSCENIDLLVQYYLPT